MAANSKDELHMLIDQLSDDDATETLAFARGLLGVHGAQTRPSADMPARPHPVPTLHRAPPIAGIEDLRAALFGAEESATEFEAAIRQWREEPESV